MLLRSLFSLFFQSVEVERIINLRRSKFDGIARTFIVLLFLIIIAALVWGNFLYSEKNPGGNDFLVHWVGAQKYVYEGISPYSDTTALAIQTMVYGRAAKGDEHELRVAYPLYSLFLFIPFALTKNYFLARALWMTLLEISLILSVVVGVRLVQWRPGKLIMVALITFSIFWYHGLRSLINGNAVILLLLCFTLSIYAIQQKQDELAGILLAFTTIKPQVGFAFILFLLFWAIVNKRNKIVFWLLGSILLLSVIALFLIPNWPLQFLQEVLRYPGYNPPGTPAQALSALLPGAGRNFGIAISIVSALVLIVEVWLARRSTGIEFVWICSLTLVLGQWLNVQTDPGNFVVMLPAAFVIFRLIEERWKNKGNLINLVMLLLFFFVPWLFFLRTLSIEYQPIQSPLMFFPIPILLALGLYWVRWWAKNPVKHIISN